MAFLNIGQKIEKVMGKEQELLDAARTGNVHTVDKLLSNKPRKSTGGGVLSHRLTSGLTSFLHQSVNVNCTDKNGYTPLHHATVNGHRDVVERLLKSDAEPGLTDHQGCTPCHLAAWHGDAEICLQLLNAGTEEPPEGAPEITPVQVNQQNISGETALHSAAQYGHVAVVDVLLQKHANPNIRNLHEESPLDLAAQYGRKEVVQLLLIKFPDLVHRPLYNCSPLHLASRNGHRDIVDVLLFNGFNIHTLTDMGTALHEAALYGKLDVVKVLLERGINVHIKDQSGLTAFDLVDAHKAKQQSYTEIKTAITEHIEKLKYSKFDTSENESLAKQPEEKAGNDEEKSPDRPVPKPRPRTYVLESPTTETAKDLYSTPQKEKKDDVDRVTSSASSVSENLSPPPLPPRTSIFPPEDRSTVIIPPESLTPTESLEESKTPPLGSKHVVMPKPRKPPRQKKPSPVPPRKTVTESEESSDTSIQSLDSSPLMHPKPVSPKVPPRPLSVRKPPAIPSAITDSQDQKKENIPNSSSVVTDQSHSSKSESDQSKLPGSKGELPAPSKENSGTPVSPTPGLPPKPCEPTIDTSVDPMFGTPVHQNLYMEMTASLTKEPEDKTEPKQSDVNSDSYGILFPKYKNTKGNSLKASPLKVKRAEFRRTNTAPDENIYVGPSSPESPLAKFKEKQGLLRRANTEPDENMYITVTEKVLTRQGRVETENEYSEIAEQKSHNSPQSPTENIYAVIAEKTDSNIYGHLADASSGGTVESKENNSNLSDKTHSGSTGADRSKSENVPAGGKPNYLDFVARKSLAQEPLTPTGYTQPPTPDFPPPSPATAMIGIELKIQEMDVKRKSRDITTFTDGTVDNTLEEDTLKDSSRTDDREEIDSNMKKTPPPPPLKPKPKSVRSLKTVPTPTPTPSQPTNSTVKTEAFQTETEHSTERAETFQIVVEESDKIIKPSTTQNSSTEKLSSDFEKLVTDKQSKAVINSSENDADKQSTNKQEVDKTKTQEQTPDIAKTQKPDNAKSQKPDNAKSQEQKADKKETEEQKPDNSKMKEQVTDKKETLEQADSPVMMRKKSSPSPYDLDHFKVDAEILKYLPKIVCNFLEDESVQSTPVDNAREGIRQYIEKEKERENHLVSEDLLKGSAPGGPRKVVSQFVYDHDQNKPGRSRPVKSTYVTFDSVMENEDDIDVDQVMKSIEVDFAQRATGNTDSLSFDEAGVWDEIADIVSSFGGNLAVSPPASVEKEEKRTESVENSSVSLSKTENRQIQGIEEWLESLDLEQYENNFRVNGFDNMDFLGPSIMEEQDLEQIGVLEHSHRKKILEAAELLPRITPIDPKNLPASVQHWLRSLRLEVYLENFLSHGYETMEQVESILWDLQLRTVLAISMLGHRKRILASLGDRQPDKQNGSMKKKSYSSMSPDEVPSPFQEIDLFKDYRNVKPTQSSSEDVREPTQMAVDNPDDDVFRKGVKGQSIRNSNIHLRPPHIAQTQSPARKWRHTPETLIKGCCNYTAEYLGSTNVSELTGVESTRAGIAKLKLKFLHKIQKSTDLMAKIPVIMLSISFKGVKFIDARSKKVICDHEIGNIFCACQDTEDLRFFAYITRDIQTAKHYCHVFKVKSSSLAHDIILTLGESFEVAYQMALKDRSMEEAMQLDRLKSQSDTEDLYSTVGPKVDSNTV